MENFDEENVDPTIEELEAMYNDTQSEFDTFFKGIETDKSELVELLNEEKKLMEALQAVQRRKREIERQRYQREVELKEKQRKADAAKLKLEEAKRAKYLEEQKAQSFETMIAEARAANYVWCEYAKPHQWEGALSLAHYGSAILADDTGLGKTLTTIMSLDLKKAKKVLILVPADVADNFYVELMTYAPHRNLIPLGNVTKGMRETIKTLTANSNEFTIVTNYEALWRDSSWLEHVEWDEIVIDEAHNAKNEKGLTFNAVDSYTYRNCTPVTATTILNSPADLYTLLHLIDPQHFNDRDTFLWTYCIQDYQGKWTFRPGGEKALVASLKGRFIKRSYTEANVPLPDMHINEVLIPEEMVPTKQLKIQKELSTFGAIMLEETGEKISMNAIIAVITRERQAAVYPAGIEIKVTEKMKEADWSLPPVGTVIFKVPDDTPSIKIDIAVRRLKDMIAQGKRCVVFSQFKTALAALEKALKKENVRVCRFDGDTNKALRVDIKRDFLRKADGSIGEHKYDVVLANYKTGGVGLNFTSATYMLQLDEDWSPAKNHQARSRIRRIGQTEETYVDVMRIDKSIDMWMKTLNERKQAIVEGFEVEADQIESLKQFFQDRNLIAKPVPDELAELDKDFLEDIDEDFLNMLKEMEDGDE